MTVDSVAQVMARLERLFAAAIFLIALAVLEPTPTDVLLLAAAAALTVLLAAKASRSPVLGLLAGAAVLATRPTPSAGGAMILYGVAIATFWWYAGEPGRTGLWVVAAMTIVAYLTAPAHGVLLFVAAIAMLSARHWSAGSRAAVRPAALYIAFLAVLALSFLPIGNLPGGVLLIASQVKAVALTSWTAARAGVQRPDEHSINVRWADGLTGEARRALERRLGLAALEFRGGRTWRYEVGDFSEASLAAIVNHPAVEDTHGFERAHLEYRRIDVRWTADLTEADRVALEQRFRLIFPEPRPDGVWRYKLADASDENLRAIAAAARLQVADLHGLDSTERERRNVNVRWTAGLTDRERAALERRYRLAGAGLIEKATWRYYALDISRDNLAALVHDPNVQDTHGIDRHRYLPTADVARDRWPERGRRALMTVSRFLRPTLAVAVLMIPAVVLAVRQRRSARRGAHDCVELGRVLPLFVMAVLAPALGTEPPGGGAAAVTPALAVLAAWTLGTVVDRSHPIESSGEQ